MSKTKSSISSRLRIFACEFENNIFFSDGDILCNRSTRRIIIITILQYVHRLPITELSCQ